MLNLTVCILHIVSKSVNVLGLARFEVFIVVLLKTGLQCLHLSGSSHARSWRHYDPPKCW